MTTLGNGFDPTWSQDQKNAWAAHAAHLYRQKKAVAGPVRDDAVTGKPDAPTPVSVFRASSFADKPVPERSWIVRDFVPDRTVTILSGDGAAGKSTLALQLAVAVSAASDWIGTVPATGPVLVVSCEDGEDEIHRRFASIAPAMRTSLAALTDLHVLPLAGHDAVMGAPVLKAGMIEATPRWRDLVATVRRIKPRLVILDTLADVFAGNENARPEARQFIGMLRGLAIENRLAVLVLAHPSLTGKNSGSGESGSTGWSNSVRSRLYLERGDGGELVDADARVLTVKKANYGRAGGQIRLRWVDGCFRPEGPTSGFDRAAAGAFADEVFLALLAKFMEQGRDVSPLPSPAYGPSVFAKETDAKGVTKRAFGEAMSRLLNSGAVRIEAHGPPSRQRKRLVLGAVQDK